MTTPITGHPDFQAIVQASSGNLFGAFTTAFPVGVTNGPVIPVANWASLFFAIGPITGAGKIIVNHYADQAGAHLIGSDSWPANTSFNPVVSSPLRGQFVQLSFNNTSGAPMTCSTYATLQSVAQDRISFPIGTQQVFIRNRVIPASGTDHYFMFRPCCGRAFYMLTDQGAGGFLFTNIDVVDELGNLLSRFYEPGLASPRINTLLEVPDTGQVRVEIDNSDAANPHTYDMSLIVPNQ